MTTTPTLLTIRQFSIKHPAFPVSRLRWIRHRCMLVRRIVRGGRKVEVKEIPPNGFADAFVVVCGRVYLDEGKFFEIIAEQNGRGEESFG